jgi:predicted Ser/Thr protein kinase
VSVPSAKEIAPPLAVGSALGPFQLLEVVGMGGMGVVYRAHDERLNRDVALKVLPDDARTDEPSVQEALLREARTAAAVTHPNIASVYEAGSIDGRAYFAMELLRGRSLREALVESPRPLAKDVARWALGVARALACLHERGWVHLDVKPENVMLGPDGEVKLLDFGLARLQDLTASNARPAGTPPYMAPEQRRGLGLDTRADVFAFGVLLQEMTTGVRARAPDSDALKRQPRVLRRVITTCLEEDRARRFASGAELASALEAARDELAAATRRRPALLVATALLALGALAFALRPTSAPRVQPHGLASLRLTGNRLARPISGAAISWDGKHLAYVDDDGLLLADATVSAHATRVAFEERITWVEAVPRRTDWGVITHAQDDRTKAYWWIDERGGSPRLLHRGTFRFAAAHPDGRSLVVIDTKQIAVHDVESHDVSWAIPIPDGRWVSAASWSPDGKRLVVGYSETVAAGHVRTLEVWDTNRREVVHTIRSPRLVQAYVPLVAGWAPDGSLLYALSDAPGSGSGAGIWRQTFDARGAPAEAASALAAFERQSIAGLGMASTWQLVTLRHDVESTVHLAGLAPESGELTSAHALTTDAFDERSNGFDSSGALWLMSYRELVPHLARRNGGARGDDALGFDVRGWAQSWPTPVAGSDVVLYWAAEGQPFQENAPWKLVAASPRGTTLLRTPAELRESVAAVGTPPASAQVRCAARVPTCVLATAGKGEVSYWRVSLEGAEPTLLFRVADTKSFAQVWQLDREATRVVRIDRDTVLADYDLRGALLRSRPIGTLEWTRSFALDEDRDAVYLAGLGKASWEDRIVRMSAAGERTLVGSTAIVYGDLVIAPDQKSLAWVERAFDTDIWLTPVAH